MGNSYMTKKNQPFIYAFKSIKKPHFLKQGFRVVNNLFAY